MQITVGDLVFDALDEGPRDGPLVLLLHGFPQDRGEWRHVTPALTDAGYRVVAPDQRGYSPGARPAGVPAYAMAELVRDTVGMLDALGVDRAHVVGHDWGAAVAWQVGGRHPDRVRTLTAVSVPHPRAFTDALMTDPDQRERSQYMRVFQAPGSEASLGGGGLRPFFAGASSVDVDHWLALMDEPGRLEAALNWYRAAGRVSVDGFPAVTVPTLYVWGDGDLALGRVAAEATGALVEGPYEFVPLAGVGHWVPDDAPDALLAALLPHLSRG